MRWLTPPSRLFGANGLRTGPDGTLKAVGTLFSPGSPGYVRGVAVAGQGELAVTTANGQVARWRPAQHTSEVLAEDFDRL